MSKINVLVVDDASFIRDLVKKCLRSYFPGIGMDDAVNGRKAQQLLASQRFDLVLCDWEMPEMSGLELLVWFRAQPEYAKTPFIMVTSRGDKENVVQAIQAGVSDYIGKPFTNEQLITKVKKALSKSGRLAALEAAGAPVLSTGVANDSLSVLTAGRTASAETVRQPVPPKVAAAAPAAAAPVARAPAPAASAATRGRGQGQLRTPNGEMECTIKAISLKEAALVVRRGDVLPQILDSVVLDLEQGDNSEVARLNAYIHSLVALDASADSEHIQVNCRFVDRDPKKMDYISRLIARGTAQKHFVPAAN